MVMRSFQVKAYPGALRKASIGEKGGVLDTLREALSMVVDLVETTFGAVEVEILLFKGKASLSAVWKEARTGGAQKAYCEIRAEGELDPLIGASVKVPIPWGPAAPIQTALAKFNIKGGPYLKIEGKYILKLGLYARPQLKQAGGEATLEGSFGLGIGVELTFGDPEDGGGLSVGAEGFGSVSLWGKLTGDTNVTSLVIMSSIGANLNPLEAKFWAKFVVGVKCKWLKLQAELKAEAKFSWPKAPVNVFTLTRKIWPTS
jgi:hypothetical protein